MLQDLQSILSLGLSFSEVVSNLIMALLCGLAISLIYRAVYNGPSYSSSFARSIVTLSMITALVIMVIGNNLARAFGLVGAMSIIRFRTAVKDIQDIIFIFFALASGMAAGVGLKIIALGGTVFIGIIVLILNKFRYGMPEKQKYVLHFYYEGDEDDTAYESVLRRYCKSFRLVNMISIDDKRNVMEISYYIVPKDAESFTSLVREMKDVPGITQLRFFFDED